MRQRLMIILVGVAVGLVARFLFPPQVDEGAHANSAYATQPADVEH